ncbi:MAG: GNAT family N-acetyltransferase [Fimbriimonadaceae bacterium]
MRLVEQGIEALAAYETVPISFEIRSRVDLEILRATSGATIAEIPTAARWKDYDAHARDRPTALAARFDMSSWLILSAFDEGGRRGGIIVAHNTPGCDMLDGRRDLAVPFDLRVDPAARGRGIGRTLFAYGVKWAQARGCTELRVETQDVNVAACRFYRAMGCELFSARAQGYGPELDEAMLIWRRRWRTGASTLL